MNVMLNILVGVQMLAAIAMELFTGYMIRDNAR